MFSDTLIRKIESSGVVAVLVIDEVSSAVPLAIALRAGGITAIELTLRTPVGLEALKAIKAELPDAFAGVGTILTTEQVEKSRAAGAAFAVAPNCDPRIIGKAHELGLPFAPGVMTPERHRPGHRFGMPHPEILSGRKRGRPGPPEKYFRALRTLEAALHSNRRD